MKSVEDRLRDKREYAARRQADPEARAKIAEARRRERADPIRGAQIRAWKKEWATKNAVKIREQARGRRATPAARAKRKAWARENPEKAIFNKVRSRANHAKIPFTLAHGDIVIPSVCPVFGMPLVVGGRKDNSASVDRVDNTRGYVPGNICVISMRANRLKSDATLAELKALVKYLEGA